MLYEIWRETVRENGGEIALQDLVSGRKWTFAQLAAEAETMPLCNGGIAYPRGLDARFVLQVLQGWRGNSIVCPLELDQAPPAHMGPTPPGIVHLKSTSATTGLPRLVAFTEQQMAADAENIVQTMKLRRDWPNLGIISLAHSYGFSNLVLPLLLHGIPLILVGSALPEALRRGAAGLEAVTLPAVPALWRNWFEADAIPACVRLAISAGAPLPLGLEQEVFCRHELKVHNFYGSSECGGIAYDSASEPRLESACVGSPLQGVDVAVGDNGCFEVRSKAVGTGYWQGQSTEKFSGVFRTSDLGQIHAGQVYVRGRMSDQINVAGRKVSPEAIERVLAGHQDVRDCLVFGVPAGDNERGETIVACVELRSQPDQAVENLKQHLIARLPAWQVPRKWWLVPSLRENQRGKVSRTQLRNEYLAMND